MAALRVSQFESGDSEAWQTSDGILLLENCRFLLSLVKIVESLISAIKRKDSDKMKNENRMKEMDSHKEGEEK